MLNSTLSIGFWAKTLINNAIVFRGRGPELRFRDAHLVVSCLASLIAGPVFAQQGSASTPPYLNLSKPRQVLLDAQPWEGKEFPHTLSVIEMNRDGFRYWGWYGLNEGKGIGLARSNDLVHWTKYEKNPLWTNARWPSVLEKADSNDPALLYFAITRDYDTPTSLIVLATSHDGISMKEEKVLVPGVPHQRNQNPNLFHDPVSGRFFLIFYRGNDKDHFEIVSRNAAAAADLDKAPEKVLIRSSETVAAPTLLYVKPTQTRKGLYYLATEIYPHRYTDNPEGEWQVKVFVADAPDGTFEPVPENPVMSGQRACLFQHIFNGRFYGYDCHLEPNGKWVVEEVEASLP